MVRAYILLCTRRAGVDTCVVLLADFQQRMAPILHDIETGSKLTASPLPTAKRFESALRELPPARPAVDHPAAVPRQSVRDSAMSGQHGVDTASSADLDVIRRVARDRDRPDAAEPRQSTDSLPPTASYFRTTGPAAGHTNFDALLPASQRYRPSTSTNTVVRRRAQSQPRPRSRSSTESPYGRSVSRGGATAEGAHHVWAVSRGRTSSTGSTDRPLSARSSSGRETPTGHSLRVIHQELMNVSALLMDREEQLTERERALREGTEESVLTFVSALYPDCTNANTHADRKWNN